MQKVSFDSVQDMLRFLPEDQRLLTEAMRELVMGCLPEVEERLSFNVPFFRKHKSICFIWPGAVPWGSKTREGVEFGFNYGSLLADEMGYLERGKRQQVFSRRYFSVDDIDEDILRSYLAEAEELDELMYREKMQRRRK